MSKINDFIKNSNIKILNSSIPFVHSTKSYNLLRLIESSGLNTELCDVYNEKLLYFFLGRPAYKSRTTNEDPEVWELPTCFIFDSLGSQPIKRTLPFDSGAFSKNLYPPYIDIMNLDNFETEGPDAGLRIISAIYGSISQYFDGSPKSEQDLKKEFNLKVTDAEVLAIRKLAQDGTPIRFDDRRFTIEIQTDSDLDFKQTPPSAVILPTPYLDDDRISKMINNWNIDIINYDIYSLSIQNYHGIIFEKFKEYCNQKGFLL